MAKEDSYKGWTRNTEGIRSAALKKREEAISRAEEAIKQLTREKKPIHFESVAEAAGVTRAWLYKQPDLRARIEHLRNQQTAGSRTIPANQKASDKSNSALVKTLKEQVKRLQAENYGLRQQLEMVHGRVVYAEEQAERYKREAETLRQHSKSENM